MQDDQKTFDQSQSPFISRLPLEIRRMIYLEMLGGVTVRLRTADGKPVAQRYLCDSDLKEPLYPRRVELELALAVLRTCRQIYSEAIEYLYASNTFSLATWDDDYPTIDYMSYYFLPQRLIQVQDLRIDWELDSFYFSRHDGITADQLQFAAWKNSWAALPVMTGLRKLHVTIWFRWRDMIDCYEEIWEPNERALLEPVGSVTAPRSFVLVLPDRRCSIDIDMGDSACVLELPK
ncbi:uncharacterized protein M421DRAFT_65081 [Didymella exigua CBS 183.55]|uniref:DUF7730 domain-containing protein n=1 Tax=Didymella exigua CBS 183.55 TaxID=1150837 RepID=A0A6A5RHI8_9PLEO|nr:uncharacterized protein M421DRAFT_65081 [Didymella exigua CBS 183.55]KAF1927795.1 hypothetical protein M421DRAFT_65081 [Didymella exigua CBS 183.55]